MIPEKVYAMKMNKVYPALIAKAERKGYTKEEVCHITSWMTGYSVEQINSGYDAESEMTYGDFFRNMPKPNPNRALVRGVICGVRVEEIEEPLMQEIRRLDKMIDELVKGKSMDKILREPKNVDEYISLWSPEIRDKLQQMRTTLREGLPDAKEIISWKMPTYWAGRNLIHFAAMKKHVGLYPGAEAVEHFAERLQNEGYKFSKGSIQFPYKQELPLALIADIAEFCLLRVACGEFA